MKKNTSENTRSDIVIEGQTARWTISELGEINGTYAGQFVFRVFLSPSQQIAANREYRELLGPNPTFAPEHESFLAYALSQLRYRIISAPPFWSSTVQTNGIEGDLPDENIIEKVLDAAIAAQLKYKEHVKEEKANLLKRAIAQAEKIAAGQSDEDDEDFVDEDEDEE